MKRRPDGRWQKAITLNGKRKFFYSYAETEKKAERDILQQMLAYSEEEENGRLLEDVSDEWYNFHTVHLEYSTTCRYKRYMEQLNEYFPKSFIKEITTNDVEEILLDMVSKDYSSKTIKDFLSVAKMIFKYAHKKKYIDEDVTFYISPPLGKAPVTREPLDESNSINLSKALDCTFGLLAFFYMCTGLRKSEALALQWKDIDFDNKLIKVYKKVYYVSNTPYIKESTKTKAGTRNVILLDVLAEQLLPLKAKPDDYVFNKDGKLLDKSYYTRQWDKFKQESKIDITAHPLRHTYSTMVFEAGVSEKDAQSLMGHSSIVVTHNIYTHIRAKRMQDTAEKLNSYMKKSLNPDSDTQNND